MASYTGARTYHKTLTGTTVDTLALANITEFTVINRAAAGGTDIFFVYGVGTTPADPTASADGSYIVQAGGGYLTIPVKFSGTVNAKLIGNGNAYTVEAF